MNSQEVNAEHVNSAKYKAASRIHILTMLPGLVPRDGYSYTSKVLEVKEKPINQSAPDTIAINFSRLGTSN